MAPHVLSAAVASAGANRHRGDSLWMAYAERARALQKRLALRDLRLMLKGYADASVRDGALFHELLAPSPWEGDAEASPRELCSIAIALAKLRFAEKDVFSSIGEHMVSRLGELAPEDAASLANAFSRAALGDHVLLPALSSYFRTKAEESPAELAPATVTLALNAFAVCAVRDSATWRCMLGGAVAPRVEEYNVTQAALIVNSIARCSDAVPSSREVLASFADHWAALGELERAASAEDLAYVASAYASLRETSHAQLNLALAMGATQRLSSFDGGQLARFCSAIMHLPSAGRDACLALVARHALADVLPDCTLGHLGLLLGTFGALRTPVPQQALRRLSSSMVARAQEAAAAQAGVSVRRGGASQTVLSSGALASLVDGAMKVLTPAQGPSILAALRPLVLELAGRGLLSPSAVHSVVAAHAHFQVRDADLLGELLKGLSDRRVAHPPKLRAEKLLVSLGMLGVQPGPLISHINESLPVIAPRLTLQEAAQALLAAAVLGFHNFCDSWIRLLVDRLCDLLSGGEASALAAIQPREAARLAAALHAVRLHMPDSSAEVDRLVEALATHSAEPHRLEPPPPAGLLREVFRALERRFGAGAVAPGAPRPGGFRADCLASRSEADGGPIAVEVDGPRRFYHGSRELVGLCRLKEEALRSDVGRAVRIGFWEWPTDAHQQDDFLQRRLAS